MNIEFKTEIKENRNFTLFNFEEIDKDYDSWEDLTIVISWTAWINVREYGIKDITPVVQSIDLEGTYTTYSSDEPSGNTEKTFSLSLKDDIDFTYVAPYNKEWQLDKINSQPSDNGGLEIDEIILDFKDKTIEVQFNPYDY